MLVADPSESWPDFAPLYRPLFDLTPPAETKALLKYLISKLKLSKGSTFLDCGCGIGRMAIPLAARGIRVTATDVSPDFLDELRQKTEKKKLRVTLVKSDMRRISFDREFDAAANLFNSFGFFERDADNALVLQKVCKSLKPGGRLLMTISNRDWYLKYFTENGWCDAGSVRIFQRRWFDYERSASITERHFLKDGSETVHSGYMRLYSPHEIITLLESTGFGKIQLYGSFEDEPVSPDRRWMIILGIRTAK